MSAYKGVQARFEPCTSKVEDVAKDLTSSPFSAYTGGCAGLVGVDVVTIFGYGVKLSEMNKPRMCNIAHVLANKPKA